MWKFVFILFVFAGSLNGSPVDKSKFSQEDNENEPTLATELEPPKENAEDANFAVDILGEKPTLSRELQPPVFDNETRIGGVFIINIFAVKNRTDDDTEDVLNDDILGKAPGMLEPVATILLVVGEDEDKNEPISLDELAKDLEAEGFKVEKIADSDATQVIKVDFDGSMEEDVELLKPGKINRVRRRRSPHLHGGLLSKLFDKGGSNGCNTCGGGGNNYPNGGTVGVIPVVVVQQPQYHQPQYQPQYHQPQYQPQHYQPQPQYHSQPQPQPHYQQPQSCDVCGGGRNHGSYSQSSAQASAQSSSGSW